MRVVLVLDRFPVPSEGFIVDKVLGLLDRGVDVHVVCWELDRSALERFPELDGVDLTSRVHHLPGRNARGAAAIVRRSVGLGRRRPWQLARLVSTLVVSRGVRARRLGIESTTLALEPDVVHFEFGWVGIRHARIADIGSDAVTMSVRGADVSYHGLDQPGAYDHVWPRLAALHCLGDDLWARARQRGCPASMPVALIPPAVDVRRFATPLRRPRDPDEPFRVVTVARLHWKKGIEHGLQAVRQVAEAGVDVRLRIVGDGPHRAAIDACIADLDLDDRVTMVGTVSRREVRDELAQAHVLLHPSLSEGFGNAVMEAQAMALPVVASDAEGLAANVADGVTGFVVPRRDHAALADRMLTIAGDPELALRMGRAGRERVATHFRPDAQVDAFVDFFRTATDRS